MRWIGAKGAPGDADRLPMESSERGMVLEHVVVLAYGPASALGSAVRHARTLVGEEGTVEVMAATRQSVPLLSKLPGEATAIEGWGIAALRQVTESRAEHLFLLIHDDVTLSRRGAATLTAAALAHKRPAVPWSNDPGVTPYVDLKRPKHPGELDQYSGSTKEKLIVGSIGFSCIVATGTQLAGPADRLIHIPAVRLSGIPVVAGSAVAHHTRRCIEAIPEGAGPDDRPLLVANLIVRDESDNIEACLNSLEGFVDRIEVIDTGSTDDTVALARVGGANVGEVDWQEHFGWARNQALDKSRDAWFVLWIDADERLTATDPEYLRRILATIAGDVDGMSIQVHNRTTNGDIASSFFANRIFSTTGTKFEGALHERVIKDDGSSLTTVEAHSIALDHYGYLDDVVDEKEKYVRNLNMAKLEYEQLATPMHAFEYARALGLGSAEPDLKVELLIESLEGDLAGAGLANVYAALANAQIDAGNHAGAVKAAKAAIELVPNDDLASAALAIAATELADYETVADISSDGTGDGPRPIFEIKGNRVIVDSLAAGALIRIGRAHEALERLESHLRDPETIRWNAVVAAAASTSDPVDSLRAIARADMSGMVVAAAARRLAPRATARLALERAEAGSPSGESIATGLLAAAIASDRELLEDLLVHRDAMPTETAASVAERLAAKGFADLAEILAHRPSDVGDFDIEAAIGEQLPRGVRVLDLRTESLSEGEDRRFDVVIAGTSTDRPLLRRIRSVIDPAGFVLAWDQPAETGSSLLHIGEPTSKPSTKASSLVADLVAEGYSPSASGPLTIARPVLDEALLEVVMESQSADQIASAHDIGIVLIGTPSPETMLWLRASIPGRLRITNLKTIDHPARLDAIDAAGVGRVLVVPASVAAEPDWVGSLLDADEPAGVGLLTSKGLIIHAGASGEGSPFASGSSITGHALLATDRPGTPLLAPYICSADQLKVGLTGRFLGGHFAKSTEADRPSHARSTLADASGESMVLALASGPSTLAPPLKDMFDGIVESANQESLIVVCNGPIPQYDGRTLRRKGIYVFDDSDAPMAAVAAAFSPSSVLYFGTNAFDGFHGAAVGGAPRAAHIAIDYHGLQADLADAHLSADSSVESLRAISRPTEPTPSVASISAPAERLPGTVSIVIPVWNNWEYTAECLDSLDMYREAPLEIIVVDNGSTDGTPQGLAGMDDMVVITNAENLGFPTAVNQGIAASSGEYICVLNNDTILTDGWLIEMLKALDVPGTGMVGPRSNQISGLQAVPDSPPLSDRAAAERWARRFVQGRQGANWLTNRLVGFCLVARRSLFEQVGGFDEGFGIGNFEDDELSARVLASGQTLRVADASVVLHHGGATFSKLGLDYGALMAKAGRHFGRRTANPSGLLTAIVLSDGDPRGAAATAKSALCIADRVRIIERAGYPIAEIEGGALRAVGIEIFNLDWHQAEGAAASLEGVEDHLVLICQAGEIIEVSDWSAARMALETSPSGPIEVKTVSGFEVRMDRPEADAISRFGTSANERFSELQIRG